MREVEARGRIPALKGEKGVSLGGDANRGCQQGREDSYLPRRKVTTPGIGAQREKGRGGFGKERSRESNKNANSQRCRPQIGETRIRPTPEKKK